ncbi:MAG: hypothetical protein Q8838_02445 [Candidatus Phytoplasma australasiaticum]|nr:hypothetical protein [Candidatus Phytoplasma australasiaticum]
MVRQNWSSVHNDDVFVNFKIKMKTTKLALSKWSKECFGDIFKQLAIREEIVKLKERHFEEYPSAENRTTLNRAHAEFAKYLKYEEELWRQKPGMQWFIEGDRNTKFFHSVVNGRRKRLEIKRIKRFDGSWVEEADIMSEVANFYSDQFTSGSQIDRFSLVELIPCVISESDNIFLNKEPTVEEINNNNNNNIPSEIPQVGSGEGRMYVDLTTT